MSRYLRESGIIRRLPDIFHRYDAIPEGLIGATIIDCGTFKRAGEGLVVEYRPAGSSKIIRAVFAFHDGGMWVEYLGAAPQRDQGTPGDLSVSDVAQPERLVEDRD